MVPMTYTIAPDRQSIQCLRCGRMSYSLEDVAHLYCGACGYHVAPSRAHERCLGCGAMDDELDGPCVDYGVCHRTVEVDEDGNPLPCTTSPEEFLRVEGF